MSRYLPLYLLLNYKGKKKKRNGRTVWTSQAAENVGVGVSKAMATKNVKNESNTEAEENQDDTNNNNILHSKTNNKKRKTDASNVTITDSDVLDCYICCEPLTIPVFQCENGHIACSNCCTQNRNECPFCHKTIGDIRCRALENVLESLQGSCQNSKHGCKIKVRFDQRKEHCSACVFSQVSCPISDCEFIATSKKLYTHFTREHPNSAVIFQYYYSFTVDLKFDDLFSVLQEKKTGVLFILSSATQPVGKAITVNRIGFTDEEHTFELVLKTEEIILSLQSVVRSIKEVIDGPTPEEFLMIPNKLFGSNSLIKLDLRIW